MKSVEEKLAKSLTAESVELIPFLPYLLQDLWELGSSPDIILDLIKTRVRVLKPIRVLDLACGKGAVSVCLAKELDCTVKGIDIMPEFIEFARIKAKEYGVDRLCDFVVGDITESVTIEKDYDIVILGAVGDVLGAPDETITKLKMTVKQGGYILLDDAYGKNGSDVDYYTKHDWNAVFEQTNVHLIEEQYIEQEELVKLNQEQQKFIVRRANELIQQYPEKQHLYESYIHSQQAECHELENDITCVTMLLQILG